MCFCNYGERVLRIFLIQIQIIPSRGKLLCTGPENPNSKPGFKGIGRACIPRTCRSCSSPNLQTCACRSAGISGHGPWAFAIQAGFARLMLGPLRSLEPAAYLMNTHQKGKLQLALRDRVCLPLGELGQTDTFHPTKPLHHNDG